MSDPQWAILALLWALLVGFVYIRADKSLPKPGAACTPEGTATCMGLAHRVLIGSFGKRYWTWRGLLFTTALCWGYAALLFASQGPYRFGASGYPVFEYLVLGVTALLPLWVHLIIHVTRVFLERVERFARRHLEIQAALLLPLIPVVTLAITLFPIAVVAGMADAGSFVPHGVGGNWIGLVEMAVATWWSPRGTGSYPLVFIPLGLPAILCGLHVASYFTVWTLCILGGAPIRQRSILVGSQFFLTGILHVFFVLCWSLVFLLDRT